MSMFSPARTVVAPLETPKTQQADIHSSVMPNLRSSALLAALAVSPVDLGDPDTQRDSLLRYESEAVRVVNDRPLDFWDQGDNRSRLVEALKLFRPLAEQFDREIINGEPRQSAWLGDLDPLKALLEL